MVRIRVLAGLIGVAFALIAAGCSSSASVANGPDQFNPVGGEPAATSAPTAAPTTAPSAAPSVPGSESGGVGSGASDGNAPGLVTGPLIIRTGSLSLEVNDLNAALLQARGKVIGLGGYAADASQTNQGEQSTALITYRIPAARWDDALDALKALASKVISEDTKAQDVTGQVVDIGARIDNLKATEKALQAIMAQATKISDILDVQNQLTDVRGQIEELSTQQAHLNDQAAMGTLAVTYTLPVVPVAVAHVTAGFSLSAEVDRAVAAIIGVGQGVAVLLVWLAIVVLPVVLVLGVLGLLAVLVVRRVGPRRLPSPQA